MAREVFLELGIRATTLEVAARAGIAEGTIFHRFKSKEELFRAAMRFDPAEALAFVERLPALSGTGDTNAILVRFAEQFLEMGRVAVPVMMMSWSNPEGPLCNASERSERFGRGVRAIAAFFEAEMAAGRLARRNPEVLARVLIGALHHFCLSEHVAPGVVVMSDRDYARQVVDVLLGEKAEAKPRARRAEPKRRES